MDIRELVGEDINKCSYNPCRWHTRRVNDNFCPKHRKIMEIVDTGTQEELDFIHEATHKKKHLVCEVCGSDVECEVFCVPGVPMSCRYCNDCLEANAHPWGILVANTVCATGDLDTMCDEWIDMVEATCRRLGRTIEEFKKQVAIDKQLMYEDLDRMNENMEKDSMLQELEALDAECDGGSSTYTKEWSDINGEIL